MAEDSTLIKDWGFRYKLKKYDLRNNNEFKINPLIVNEWARFGKNRGIQLLDYAEKVKAKYGGKVFRNVRFQLKYPKTHVIYEFQIDPHDEHWDQRLFAEAKQAIATQKNVDIYVNGKKLDNPGKMTPLEIVNLFDASDYRKSYIKKAASAPGGKSDTKTTTQIPPRPIYPVGTKDPRLDNKLSEAKSHEKSYDELMHKFIKKASGILSGRLAHNTKPLTPIDLEAIIIDVLMSDELYKAVYKKDILNAPHYAKLYQHFWTQVLGTSNVAMEISSLAKKLQSEAMTIRNMDTRSMYISNRIGNSINGKNSSVADSHLVELYKSSFIGSSIWKDWEEKWKNFKAKTKKKIGTIFGRNKHAADVCTPQSQPDNPITDISEKLKDFNYQNPYHHSLISAQYRRLADNTKASSDDNLDEGYSSDENPTPESLKARKKASKNSRDYDARDHLIKLIRPVPPAGISILSTDIPTHKTEPAYEAREGSYNSIKKIAEQTGASLYDEDAISEGNRSEDPVSEDAVSEEPISEDAVSEGGVSEGGVSEGDMSEGDMSEGGMSEGGMSEGDMSEGDMSEGDMSEGDVSKGYISQDDVSPYGEEFLYNKMVAEPSISLQPISKLQPLNRQPTAVDAPQKLEIIECKNCGDKSDSKSEKPQTIAAAISSGLKLIECKNCGGKNGSKTEKSHTAIAAISSGLYSGLKIIECKSCGGKNSSKNEKPQAITGPISFNPATGKLKVLECEHCKKDNSDDHRTKNARKKKRVSVKSPPTERLGRPSKGPNENAPQDSRSVVSNDGSGEKTSHVSGKISKRSDTPEKLAGIQIRFVNNCEPGTQITKIIVGNSPYSLANQMLNYGNVTEYNLINGAFDSGPVTVHVSALEGEHNFPITKTYKWTLDFSESFSSEKNKPPNFTVVINQVDGNNKKVHRDIVGYPGPGGHIEVRVFNLIKNSPGLEVMAPALALTDDTSDNTAGLAQKTAIFKKVNEQESTGYKRLLPFGGVFEFVNTPSSISLKTKPVYLYSGNSYSIFLFGSVEPTPTTVNQFSYKLLCDDRFIQEKEQQCSKFFKHIIRRTSVLEKGKGFLLVPIDKAISQDSVMDVRMTLFDESQAEQMLSKYYAASNSGSNENTFASRSEGIVIIKTDRNDSSGPYAALRSDPMFRELKNDATGQVLYITNVWNYPNNPSLILISINSIID